jgi:undecaprenyl-diphosphatase
VVPETSPQVHSFPVVRYLLTLLAFALLAGYVADFPTPLFDRTLFDAIHGIQSALLDPVMRSISYLGETVPAFIISAVAVVAFWVKGFRREALWLAICLAVVWLAASVIKGIIDRARPDGGDFSFVSGHTSYFTAFSGYLLFTLKRTMADRRWLAAGRVALVVFIASMGFSRIYLGDHWPTDVFGGFMLGVLVLIPVLWRVDNPARIAT